jgi:hypothetical protein
LIATFELASDCTDFDRFAAGLLWALLFGRLFAPALEPALDPALDFAAFVDSG